MDKEVSNKIESQVLLHKLQEVAYDIARSGGGKSLKPLQDIGLLDENFKLSENFTMENFNSGKPILDPRLKPKN